MSQLVRAMMARMATMMVVIIVRVMIMIVVFAACYANNLRTCS